MQSLLFVCTARITLKILIPEIGKVKTDEQIEDLSVSLLWIILFLSLFASSLHFIIAVFSSCICAMLSVQLSA